jgi:hypothetical protein
MAYFADTLIRIKHQNIWQQVYNCCYVLLRTTSYSVGVRMVKSLCPWGTRIGSNFSLSDWARCNHARQMTRLITCQHVYKSIVPSRSSLLVPPVYLAMCKHLRLYGNDMWWFSWLRGIFVELCLSPVTDMAKLDHTHNYYKQGPTRPSAYIAKQALFLIDPHVRRAEFRPSGYYVHIASGASLHRDFYASGIADNGPVMITGHG